MKKLLLLFLLTSANYLAFSATTVTQKEWRWRKDNGSETSAGWEANQDAALTKVICDTAANLRLRMVFLVPYNSATTPGGISSNKSVNWNLSYSTSASGSFTVIPSTPTANEHFRMATSPNVADGDATSQLLTSTSEVYSAGEILDSNRTPGVIYFYSGPGVDGLTEHEWVIRPTADAQLQTYYFKLDGLDGYSGNLPQLTFTSTFGSTVVTDVSCNSGSNGAIDLMLSGATSPYTFDWGNSITTEDRTGLVAGTYNVTVTDDNGCTGTNSAIVAEPSTTIIASVAQDVVACSGSNGGSATVTASGGAGTLTYAWSPSGGTAATAASLAPAAYTVTVTDDNSCIEKTVTIVEQVCTGIQNSSDVSATISLYPNPSSKDGIVSLNTTGNFKIEKITLMNAQGKAMSIVSGQQDLMIQDLEAGVYMVEIVTDKGVAVKKLFIQ